MRSAVQLAFVLLTVVGVFLVAGNAERWCPFGGVEAIYTYVQQGNMTCSLGVSNFFLLGGVLLTVLLLRRAFCGYACPVGAISEWLQRGARVLGLRARRVPRGLDAVLSVLKYAVLGVILFFTWRAGELVFRGYCPAYALLGRHGEDITYWAYVVSGAIVVLSFFLTVPFCRWLCPLAAVFNPLSRFGLARVKRSDATCAGCGECEDACPMAIPVQEVEVVTHARCTSCLECVGACPWTEEGALAFHAGPARPRRWRQAIVAGALVLVLSVSVAGAYLFPLPSFRWSRGTEPAATATLEIGIEDLTCRGRATLLTYFLERDDELELPGYLQLEAWPGPGAARTRITYDPQQVGPDDIEMAITEAYFESASFGWRFSPFTIVDPDATDG